MTAKVFSIRVARHVRARHLMTQATFHISEAVRAMARCDFVTFAREFRMGNEKSKAAVEFTREALDD